MRIPCTDPPAYHRGCGGEVRVVHYRATWDEWHGGSPPETCVVCETCGEIDWDQVTDYPQEPCEGECGRLTDYGAMCDECREREEAGRHASTATDQHR